MADERLHFTDSMSCYNAMSASEHVVRYLCVSGICGGRRILDVACGEGYGSSLLAGWGAAEVVGVDIAAEAIGVAQRVFGRPNISFLQGDACKLSDVLGDTPHFDLIVSFETIEHVADVPALLSGMRQHLADGGTIVISCPNDHVELEANPYHVRLYTFDEFRAATTAILGAASGWLLGTPAHGHLLYPMDDACMEDAGESGMTLLTKCRGLRQAAVIPAQHNIAPGAATCKFYVGYWGEAIEIGAVVSPQSFPAFAEPWRAIAYFKDQVEELVSRSQQSAARVDALHLTKMDLDRQLADVRRRALVHARIEATAIAELKEVRNELAVRSQELATMGEALNAAMADLAQERTELRRWLAFQQSRTFRAMQIYIRSYTLPVIGPILRGVRRGVGIMIRGAGQS